VSSSLNWARRVGAWACQQTMSLMLKLELSFCPTLLISIHLTSSNLLLNWNFMKTQKQKNHNKILIRIWVNLRSSVWMKMFLRHDRYFMTIVSLNFLEINNWKLKFFVLIDYSSSQENLHFLIWQLIKYLKFKIIEIR
jgi:hypothetical protein